MAVRHLAYERGVLRILDQTKLPDEALYLELADWPSVGRAIEEMRVRGAPAIGIAGAYGMAIAARANVARPDFTIRMMQAAAGLSKSRPTAVNLTWAVHRIIDDVRARAVRGENAETIAAAVEALARRIHEDDIESCRRIGDAGATLLPSGATVLTHCNTGSLATGGYGTALGVIRSAWNAGNLRSVVVSETRPLLQGARLTAWELAQDGIPHTLISDSTAALFMREGRVQAVVVGADRIACNGDVANKIGTYGLAVLARHHGIPFIVAAPKSTFDPDVADGAAIPIEQRAAGEVTHVRGVRIAPDGTHAANPAFDVTPSEFVTAIATEFGVLAPPFRESIATLHATRAEAVAPS
jgi:methylthioribose-1-phosphate isomerase